MNYGLLLEYHLLYFVNRRHIPIVFEIAFGSELSSIAKQNRHFATIQAANLQVRYRSDHICKCTQNSQTHLTIYTQLQFHLKMMRLLFRRNRNCEDCEHKAITCLIKNEQAYTYVEPCLSV